MEFSLDDNRCHRHTDAWRNGLTYLSGVWCLVHISWSELEGCRQQEGIDMVTAGLPVGVPVYKRSMGPGNHLRTADLEEDRIDWIQFLHLTEKPQACKTRSSPTQSTVSKAFAKSSFRTIVGSFLFLQVCTNSAAKNEGLRNRPPFEEAWLVEIN